MEKSCEKVGKVAIFIEKVGNFWLSLWNYNCQKTLFSCLRVKKLCKTRKSWVKLKKVFWYQKSWVSWISWMKFLKTIIYSVSGWWGDYEKQDLKKKVFLRWNRVYND